MGSRYSLLSLQSVDLAEQEGELGLCDGERVGPVGTVGAK